MHVTNNKNRFLIFFFFYTNKHKCLLIFFFFIAMIKLKAQDEFLIQQLEYPRVSYAFNETIYYLKDDFESKNLSWPNFYMFIRAIKDEGVVEVWIKNDSIYKLFKTYDFCATSGSLGPKSRQGDLQIPEGIYYINRFNPISSYWLSLGINYPNKSDLIRSTAKDPGGDIFLHGNCVTIGCIPLTDELIKEVYVMAVLAKNNGQLEIPVHIYPYRLTNASKQKKYTDLHVKHKQLWTNLYHEYLWFENNKTLRKMYIDDNSKYIFY